ncbi:MAG: 9-O-acetylesterase, partial [Verrucomicrobia bacterium]|nr:9-O-acetylesterase [Verrucomicrobiota bacterium]
NSCLVATQAVKFASIGVELCVLQRDQPVPVWGWAEPDEEVRVSFAGQELKAVTAATGKWTVTLEAMTASKDPREMTIAGGGTEKPVVLSDILVGDVWICSGQSNMEWPLQAATQSTEEVAAANYPHLRHIKIGGGTSPVPLPDIQGTWQVCTPQTAGGFTAVGYFFARYLQKELDVPMGLMGSNWGGTMIEPWTPPVGFRQVPELKAISEGIDATDPTTEAGRALHLKLIADIKVWIPEAEQAIERGEAPRPAPALPVLASGTDGATQIFNTRIHPLIPFGIRGAIWYQGESNGGEGEIYYHKMRALISGWRTLWNDEFPFYFVQLANFGGANNIPAGGDGYAKVREAQRRSLSIPKTGMAVIIDIGEAGNIHPANKQDVGARLALWALANEYEQKGLVHSGPLYKRHTVEDGSIRIEFDHVEGGLMVGKKVGLEPVVEVEEGTLERFAVAGKDKVWQWADAVIEDDAVLVSCPAVPVPVAVRYAFSHNPQGCNLYNTEGVPASPFRTDDW